jgi:membrane protein YfhO
MRTDRSDTDVPGVVAFGILAAVLIALVLKDAILHGWVLGQSDILFQFEPWHAHAPPRWRVRNPVLTDVPTVFTPFLAYARAEITSGRFPLWSPGIYAGHPFFASFQSAILSPFTAVAYLVPLPHATTAMAALRLFVGGVGMYVYLRTLGLGAAGASFGGVAFLLNPFTVVWLEHPLSGVASWLPWMLAAIESCAQHPRARGAALVALATAALHVTGHPETAVKVLLLCGAYALVRAISLRQAAVALTLVGGGVVVGTLLSLVQLLPFLEYVRESRVLALRAPWAVSQLTNPPVSVVTTFVPDFFGNPSVGPYALPYSNYCEAQAYPGIATWILALVAMTSSRRRAIVIFFAAAAAIAFLAMYGTVATKMLAILVPPLRVAAVSRFGLLAIASLMVMAAIGVDEVWREPAGASSRIRAIVATAGAIVMGAIVVAFLQAERDPLEAARILDASRQAALISAILAGAVVVLVWLAPRLPRQFIAAAFAAVLGVDLVSFATGFHPMTPPGHMFPPVPELDVIRSDPGVFRVAGWNDVLLPNTSLVYGVEDFRGYDGIGLASYLNFLDLGFRPSTTSHALVHFATPQLIDLLNVKYLVAPADVAVPSDRFTAVTDGAVRVYRNEHVQPRAFLASDFVVLHGDDARRALRSGAIDLRRVAILDDELSPSDRPEPGADAGRATITAYDAARLVIETDTARRRLLVLSDVFYPGWRAAIDGTPAVIHRADYAFRAVSVPAGRHAVTFEYAPDSFTWGLYGTIVGLIVLVALLAL